MVAQKGTEDARVVESEGFGPVIDLHEPQEAVARLLAIDGGQLLAWREAVAGAPRNLFVLSDDHERLVEEFRG
jgi:hypothetical protein